MARVPFQIEVRENDGDPINTASISLTQRIGGAAVTHWSAESGGVSSAAAIATDANGRSALRWVDPGSYNAAISKAGFTTSTRAFDAARGDAVNLIADDSIGVSQWADNSITAAKLTSNAITLNKIVANAVTEPKLADNAVSTRTVVVSAVTNAKIADNAVTAAKILDRSVLPEHIGAGAVGGGTVGTNELADGAVDNAAIAASQVLTTHFMTASVTNAKLAPNSITDDHIPIGALGPEHIDNEVLPVGMIVAYAGAAPPSAEWLFPQGQSVLRADYPVLFANIGTFYGSVDGTHFTLPDYRGRTPVGVGTEGSVNALGASDTALGTTLGNRGPYHGHTIGSMVITGGGDHLHWYYQGIDRGEGLRTGSGPDHVYDGQVASGTHNTGPHSHTVSGIAGDLTEPYDQGNNQSGLHHLVVNFMMKVK